MPQWSGPLKTVQQKQQDFESASDHFRALCNRGLSLMPCFAFALPLYSASSSSFFLTNFPSLFLRWGVNGQFSLIYRYN